MTDNISPEQKEFNECTILLENHFKGECLYRLAILCEKLKSGSVFDEDIELLYYKSIALYQECFTSDAKTDANKYDYSKEYLELLLQGNSFACNYYGNATNDIHCKIYFYTLGAKKDNVFACKNLSDIDSKYISLNTKKEHENRSFILNCHFTLIDHINKSIENSDVDKAAEIYIRFNKYYCDNKYMINTIKENISVDRLNLIKTNIIFRKLQKDTTKENPVKRTMALDELQKILSKDQLLAIELYKQIDNSTKFNDEEYQLVSSTE